MGVLPEVARGVDVSIPSAGHVVSAYALGVVVGAPLLAAVGAKLPRRRLLVLLMLAYAVGNGLSAVAPSYETLIGARFLAGLPHGAFFGVASLVAAEMAGEGRRSWAIARVLLGLTVANVVGVPLSTALGQTVGWRAAFAVPAVLAFFTALAVLRFVPYFAGDPAATIKRELGALRRVQVWLVVAVGAIGGGGFFAVYTYAAPIVTDRAGLDSSAVPFALAVFGTGMVVGNLLAGPLLDRWPLRGMIGVLLVNAGTYVAFAFTSTLGWVALSGLFLIGCTLVLPVGLQTRLADVSHDAQTLGAALNHSAFNLANALGAWLGGLVLAAGLGLQAPMWVAVACSLTGLAIFTVSLRLERRSPATAVQ